MNEYKFPTKCPECGHELEISGCHLICNNVECDGTKYLKFERAVGILKMDFYGESTIKKIYDGGINNIVDLLNPEIYNKEFLRRIGFPDGSSIVRLLKEIKKIKSISLEDIILSISPNQAGHTIAKQIAKMYTGLEYSTYGLQNKLFEYFQKQEIINKKDEIIAKLNSLGIEIEKPKEETKMENSITFEMTGSPKPFYDKKETLENDLKASGYEHTKLDKNCQLLITDDYSSNSSKMAKASKLGIEIITYEDLLKRIKE